MGDIGIPELLIILAILLIVFGPNRLAGVGRSLGQSIREFRVNIRDEAPAPKEPAESPSNQTTNQPL